MHEQEVLVEQETGSSEHVNEPLGSIKCGEFFDLLANC
jgi:hypothetical protein